MHAKKFVKKRLECDWYLHKFEKLHRLVAVQIRGAHLQIVACALGVAVLAENGRGEAVLRRRLSGSAARLDPAKLAFVAG